VRAIRDELDQRVQALLAELAPAVTWLLASTSGN